MILLRSLGFKQRCFCVRVDQSLSTEHKTLRSPTHTDKTPALLAGVLDSMNNIKMSHTSHFSVSRQLHFRRVSHQGPKCKPGATCKKLLRSIVLWYIQIQISSCAHKSVRFHSVPYLICNPLCAVQALFLLHIVYITVKVKSQAIFLLYKVLVLI